MSLFSFLAPGTRAVPFSSTSAFSLGRASSWPRSPAGWPAPFLHLTVRVHCLLPFLPRTPDSVVTVPLKTNARPDGEIRLSRLVSSDGVRPGAEMMGEGKRGGGADESHSSARLWWFDSLSLVLRAPCPGPSLLPSFSRLSSPRLCLVVPGWSSHARASPPPTPVFQARLDEARFFLTLSCVRALTIPRCDAR